MDNITNNSTSIVDVPQPEYMSYNDGNWFSRVFNSKKLDIENQNIDAYNQRAYNDYQTRLAMAYNSQEAEKNRAFQQYMSDTAYSRAITDLKRNGLNPYLSLSNSASTPSGTASSVSPFGSLSSYKNVGSQKDLFSTLVGSALYLATKIITRR